MVVLAARMVGLYLLWRVLKLLLSLLMSTKYYDSFYASTIDDLSTAYNNSVRDYKLELFRQVASSLKSIGGDVLEIGVGTGANLEFYPKGCCLIALDPSSEMRQLFEAKNKKYSHVNIKRFIQGCAEDLKEIPDSSIGVIVCTKVMCSVRNKRKALLEFKRVLKPEGICYFLEHVAAPCGTWQRTIQDMVEWSGLWAALHAGCSCNCELWKYIHEAGFRKVTYRQFTPPKPQKTSWLSPWLLYSSHFLGYVQKAAIQSKKPD